MEGGLEAKIHEGGKHHIFSHVVFPIVSALSIGFSLSRTCVIVQPSVLVFCCPLFGMVAARSRLAACAAATPYSLGTHFLDTKAISLLLLSLRCAFCMTDR